MKCFKGENQSKYYKVYAMCVHACVCAWELPAVFGVIIQCNICKVKVKAQILHLTYIDFCYIHSNCNG